MIKLSDGAEQVVVHLRKIVGRDELNNAVFGHEDIPLDGVLVQPGNNDDLGDGDRPDGVEIHYTLHLPKTWKEDLEKCEVTVRGKRMSVIGYPKVFSERITPGEWNKSVLVGVVHG